VNVSSVNFSSRLRRKSTLLYRQDRARTGGTRPILALSLRHPAPRQSRRGTLSVAEVPRGCERERRPRRPASRPMCPHSRFGDELVAKSKQRKRWVVLGAIYTILRRKRVDVIARAVPLSRQRRAFRQSQYGPNLCASINNRCAVHNKVGSARMASELHAQLPRRGSSTGCCISAII